MRWAGIAVVVLSGCFSKPAAPGTGLDAGADAVSDDAQCQEHWVPAGPLTINTADVDLNAAVQPSGETLVWLSTQSGTFEVYALDLLEPTATPRLAVGAMTEIEMAPTWSGDGNTLYYGVLGKWVAYDIASGMFGNRRTASELNELGSFLHPTFRGDDLQMFSSNGVDLFSATRARTSDLFVDSTRVVELDTSETESSPTVTANGLTLYFVSDLNGPYRVYRATRSDLSQPFGSPTMIPELGEDISDINVAADNSAMYLTMSVANGDIFRFDRVCD